MRAMRSAKKETYDITFTCCHCLNTYINNCKNYKMPVSKSDEKRICETCQEEEDKEERTKLRNYEISKPGRIADVFRGSRCAVGKPPTTIIAFVYEDIDFLYGR